MPRFDPYLSDSAFADWSRSDPRTCPECKQVRRLRKHALACLVCLGRPACSECGTPLARDGYGTHVPYCPVQRDELDEVLAKYP